MTFRVVAWLPATVILCALPIAMATMPAAAATLSDPQPPYAVPQITQAIDSRYSPMQTGVRPEATAANDLGPVDDDFALDHLVLLLRRPVESARALDAFMAGQTDPRSPDYHHWLTARQVGRFGPAPSDIETIMSWLRSQGFAVARAHADGMSIDFSGNAGQVKRAFKTEIHHLNVGGVAHIANMTVPQVPTALSPAVIGVVSLNDFLPHSTSGATIHLVDAGAETHYDGTVSVPDDICPTGDPFCTPGTYLIGARDLATIYGLNALFAANINGRRAARAAAQVLAASPLALKKRLTSQLI